MIDIINNIRDLIISELGYNASTTATIDTDFNQNFSSIIDDAEVLIPVNVNLSNGNHNNIGEKYTRSFNLPIAVIVGRPIEGDTDTEKTQSIIDRMTELDTMYNNISKLIQDNDSEIGAVHITQNNDEISHNVEVSYQSCAMINFQIEYIL